MRIDRLRWPAMLIGAFVLLGVIRLHAAETEVLLRADGFPLSAGKSHELTWKGAGPVCLWLRARIERQEGDGEYALQLRLNGKPVTPENAMLLNKSAVWDVVEAKGTLSRRPCYTAQIEAWYLRADNDFEPFNAGAQGAEQVRMPSRLTAAPVSHYYDYLFLLRAAELAELNRLTVESTLPEGDRVAVAGLIVADASRNALLWRRPWMEAVFDWQAPALSDLVPEDGLVISACAGEYEPVSFAVFALGKLSDLGVEVAPWAPVGHGPAAMDPDVVSIYAIESLNRRDSLGEAGFIAQMPFIPEKWQGQSPELLRPLAETNKELGAGRTRRFILDMHVPSDQLPGLYRTTVTVRADGRVLRRFPLQLRVLPFKLLRPRQRYWIWRLQWTPLWQPDNVACLRDIKAHGFNGLARVCGAGFKIRQTPDGRLIVDGSQYERMAKLLRQVGLAPRACDDGIDGAAWAAALRAVGLKPCNAEFFGTHLAPKWKGTKAAGPTKDVRQQLELMAEDAARDPVLKQTGIPSSYTERVLAQRENIEAHMVDVFRQARTIAERLELDFYIFPVDEPCGTPWRREWVRLISRLAHEADVRIFNTRNNFSWDAGIDVACIGARISALYEEPEMRSGSFIGDLLIPPLPDIGRFRGGPAYHFKGWIDEVRIYQRPLSAEQVRRQHAEPATEGLTAHYRFESPAGQARDSSGHGRSALLHGARKVAGRGGHVLELDGEDDYLAPPQAEIDLSRGWAISMWLRGTGCPFGRGYPFYCQGGRLRFKTTEEYSWIQIGPSPGTVAWDHLTVSFNNREKTWHAYLHDEAKRDWYRRNVKSNYMQIRSMPAAWPRFKMGVMAWHYRGIEDVTAFCYDWNANHLYVVWPEGGERFHQNGTKWYGTVGWLGTREGIDDARYLHTLESLLTRQIGRGPAEARVRKILAPIDGPFYRHMATVLERFGGFEKLRAKITSAALQAEQ